NDSLLTIIDQTTVKLDVRSFIRRIDPEGKDRVQIWLERINFDDLVHLLNILKRNHNINVESLSINRQSEQGQVDARITVKGNS
ncbi:MAG: type II secretion system protein GspM, partial [Thioalkalispiraceae bacterium]